MQLSNQSTFNDLVKKEWLVTNGLGSYAASSITGANTRRYHGLLVASFNPPTDRRVLVSKVEERLLLAEESVELSSNQYPGTVHPQGYQYLTEFKRAPLPEAIFRVGENQLAKTVFMVYGSNTTVIEYENRSEQAFDLALRPLLVYRDYHSLFQATASFDFYQQAINAHQTDIYAHYGAPALHFCYSKGTYTEEPAVYRNFEYAYERYRGLDFQEDAHQIGQLVASLSPGERLYLVFSTDDAYTSGDPAQWKQAEIDRLEALKPTTEDAFLRDLVVSGDQFLVERRSAESNTLLAGYHWFTDWGRDTMIAMRGLTVAMGKKDISESIIRTFLQSLDGGMLPNRFPDSGETPEYNTIDATLWLFVVLYEYHQRFQDTAFIEEVYPKLTSIIQAHREGTRFQIHETEEGLLFGGEGLSQLTWMDARVGDFVVTPRQGCPVEVNALWYNAQRIYAEFGTLLGFDMGPTRNLADRTGMAFRRFFINEQGYLNDVVIPNNYIDTAIRPNQIYALSLPFMPLERETAESVLRIVGERLYTDYGLRSLDPADPDFKGTYGGDQFQRDSAYHQGTVWAFLWGEYALAYLQLHGRSDAAKARIRQQMEALRQHFYEADGLYAISEIFDGEQPDAGRGCVQQAWSIGMLLRVYQELGQLNV